MGTIPCYNCQHDWEDHYWLDGCYGGTQKVSDEKVCGCQLAHWGGLIGHSPRRPPAVVSAISGVDTVPVCMHGTGCLCGHDAFRRCGCADGGRT